MPLYIIAQIFGILATITCLIMPLFKKKWQILMGALFANLFVFLNLVLLGEIGSGAFLSAVGIIQSAIAFIRIHGEKNTSLFENIIFLLAYLACGVMGYNSPLDIIPVIAAVLYMLSVSTRDEQNTRKLLLGNFLCWSIYDASLLATAFFGHFAGFCTTAFALWKYRKNKSM